MSFLMKLTSAGAAKIAAANAGDPLELTEMAAGDGSGAAVPAPTGAEIALVNEVWRGDLSALSVSVADAQVMIAEAVIPMAEGPFTVREIGVFDVDGDLFAYGNFPETYKPDPSEGSAREMLIRASIRVATTDNVTISIDESAVFATQAWCNGRFLQIDANLSDVDDAAAALANLGGAPLANPVFTGNPRAPTPAPGDNDTSLSTTAFVVAAITTAINNLIDSSPGALNTLNELAAALADDPNFATTITNALALKAPLANPNITGLATLPQVDIGSRVKSNVTAVAASAVNCSVGNYFTKTATGALTWTVTNVPATGAFHFLLELTNGGLGAQTWMAGIKWPGGIAPTLQSAGVDLLGFITDDGGLTWRGSHLMRDSK